MGGQGRGDAGQREARGQRGAWKGEDGVGAAQGGLGEGEKAEKARVGGRGKELSHILI